ncbi:MAG: peptide-methionine (S)-S-oxide reductase MsrA [Bacteroidia bacterium]
MKKFRYLTAWVVFGLVLISCSSSPSKPKTMSDSQPNTVSTMDTATFGGGCFWCMEAQFQLLNGVIKVESGYSGGHTVNPTYHQVCTDTTGHAEVTQIYFDKTKITFDQLLEAFWQAHDPTTLNRQGNDVGSQYRSVIYYHNPEQKLMAESYKKKLNESGAYSSPVVTEITAFHVFYKAENYHQDYFKENGKDPYCQFVIAPKVEKFRKVFEKKLK